MKDNAQITQEDIVSRAIVMFCRYGYRQVTIDQLADDLGCSKAVIYKHFRTKNSLMHATLRIINRHLEIRVPTLAEIQTRLENESKEEILRSYFDYSNEYCSRNCLYYRILYQEILNFKRITAITYRIWQNYYFALRRAMEYLALLNAIPKQQDGTLAEMWTRVRFMFSLMETFDPYIYGNQYKELVETLITLALNGDNRIDCNVTPRPIINDQPQTNPENFEEEIIEAACELFSHYGYEKTTIRLIALDLGCYTSTIYYRFKNKQDIFQKSIECIRRNALKHEYFCQDLFHKYHETNLPQDLITILSANYIFHDTHRIKQNRIWIDMIYRSSDIRYHCFGHMADKCVAFKIAIFDLDTGRKMTTNQSIILATIYTYYQSSINIEDAILYRVSAESETFRINAARIMASAILYGIPPENNDIA